MSTGLSGNLGTRFGTGTSTGWWKYLQCKPFINKDNLQTYVVTKQLKWYKWQDLYLLPLLRWISIKPTQMMPKW